MNRAQQVEQQQRVTPELPRIPDTPVGDPPLFRCPHARTNPNCAGTMTYHADVDEYRCTTPAAVPNLDDTGEVTGGCGTVISGWVGRKDGKAERGDGRDRPMRR